MTILPDVPLLRDSAIFSVIASEWPATKAAMRLRLTRWGHREAGA